MGCCQSIGFRAVCQSQVQKDNFTARPYREAPRYTTGRYKVCKQAHVIRYSLFTPPTRTRHDSLVLSVSAMWTS